MGRGGLPWLALAPIVGAGSRRLGRPVAATVSGAAIGSALATSVVLARAVARPRPCELGTRSLIPCPDGGSFPSDQTAAAFAGAEILGWFEPRLRTPLLAAGTAIALARVRVGVHHPTDVLGGAALGMAVGRAARAGATRHNARRDYAAKSSG